jgi:hypothetical protein
VRTRRSEVPRLLALQLFVVFLMLSCASSQPTRRLIVHVREGFVGTIRIATCVGSSTATDVYARNDGVGETSACPARGEDVAVTLVRGAEQRVIASEEIVIPRTGDGIATSIQVNVRSN